MSEENTDIKPREVTEIDKYGELDDIDREIIRLKIASPALTMTKLADIIGIHRTVVSKRLNKEQVRAAIEELQKTAIQILLDSQAEAARRLRTIMRTGKEENAVRACREILKGVLSESFSAKVDIEDINTEDDARKLTTEQLKKLIQNIRHESES